MKYSVYILATLFLFASCTKEIPFDSEIKQPKITINSAFTPDSSWAVKLTRSLSVIDNGQLSDIENATVIISGSDGTTTPLTYDAVTGFYTSTATLVANVNYTISASAPNYPNASSTGLAKQPVPIIQVDTSSRTSEWSKFKIFKIKFNDPSFSQDYYMVTIIQRVEDYTYDWMGNIVDTFYYDYKLHLNSSDLSSDQDNDWNEAVTFSDNLFNGQTKVFTCETYQDFPNNDKFLIVLSRLSEDFYKYKKTIMAYWNSHGNPFAEPVRVHTNVEGGFGIFAGLSHYYYVIP
ncbi:MAG: DUF4249 domain-containing protein [Flavobacteriales bacterium]